MKECSCSLPPAVLEPCDSQSVGLAWDSVGRSWDNENKAFWAHLGRLGRLGQLFRKFLLRVRVVPWRYAIPLCSAIREVLFLLDDSFWCCSPLCYVDEIYIQMVWFFKKLVKYLSWRLVSFFENIRCYFDKTKNSAIFQDFGEIFVMTDRTIVWKPIWMG